MKKSCGSCHNGWFKFLEWIKSKFYPEFRELFKLAWPIILMNLFRFLNPTISVIMCGHLRKTEFDASSLANALINIFGVSVDLGFSTACDTLFAQISGSRNKKKLGLMLQRAVLVMSVIYFLLACFHLNIEPILILLQQDVEISRLTAIYVTLYLPGLFFDFHYLAISRYLQNQNIVYPMMISSFFSCIFNAVGQYIAIYVLGYGIEASAIIQGCACFVAFIIQLMYVLISKVYQSTWQGFEFLNSLEGWGIFFKLGIPGIVMIGVEEWAFEIANFMAGAINDVQLGGQSIAFQIEFLSYMIHTGLAIAVSIRCGQHLGAKEPEGASLSAKVVMISDLCISVITSTIILSFRKYLPYIFTNDEEIRLLAEKILLIIAFIQYFDAGCSSTAAIFRACGKQLKGAIVMFTSYYALGVPLGFVLVFVVKTDIRGFWLALLTALVVEVTIYLILIYRINWYEEAEKAKLRIKESKLSETRIDDFTDVKTAENFGLLASEDNSKSDSEIPVTFPGPKHRRPTSSVTDILISGQMLSTEIFNTYTINKRTILKRTVLCGVTLSLFTLSIFSRIYLPRELYVPCIKFHNNVSNLPLDKHYPFCNDSRYKY